MSFRRWKNIRPNPEKLLRDLETDATIDFFLFHCQKGKPMIIINLIAAVSVVLADQFEDEESQVEVSQRTQHLLAEDPSAIHALLSGEGSLSDVVQKGRFFSQGESG